MSSAEPNSFIAPTRAVGPKDRALWERACQVIPWATQTNAKRRRDEAADYMPAFLRRGEGCRVWDVDGQEYIDYVSSLGPIILGHGYPAVQEAVLRQLRDGVLLSMAHPLEVDLAEQLRDIVPCAERVRFLKTGAEANLAAVRLARAVTGRDLLVITGYHGWSDPFMPTKKGVPEAVRRLTIRCPFGDAEAVDRAFAEYPDHIAAVLTPPSEWGEGDPRPYLQMLREKTRQEGAVLIFDEVLTGFRLALGGGQEYFGVTPDLAVFGKAVANGFPIAVVAGSASIMDEGLNRTYITSTHAGEILSLAAALATVSVMQTESVHAHIWEQGGKLMGGMNRALERRRVPGVSVGLPPHFSTHFRTGDAEKDAALGARLSRELFRRGLFTPGRWVLSYSHGDEDIALTLSAFDESVASLEE